jgi:hypothetical protein
LTVIEERVLPEGYSLSSMVRTAILQSGNGTNNIFKSKRVSGFS